MSKSTVLIIDNDADTHTILTTSLEHQDCRAFAVENTHKAIAMLKNIYFDLVLLDNASPSTSELDAVKEMKTLQPNLKIIMLSVADEENTRTQAFQVGADAYLVKPVSTLEMMHIVDKTLAHS